MNIPTLQQLLEAGVHFGHRVSRVNPRMQPYIYGTRDGVNIIDLTKSEQGLKEACQFVTQLGKDNGVLLFVGTKKQAQPIILEAAKKVGSPYLITRWIGGFLTNFDQIKINIKKMKDLTEQKEKGQLNKYTKKEQLLLDRKVAKWEKDLGGVVDLDKEPDAIFLIDGAREATAIREAARRGVKIVAVADTNCDPTLIDYPIPGNDDAIRAIQILVDAIAGAYQEGKNKIGKAEEKVEKKKTKEAKPDITEILTAEVPEEVAAEVAEAEEKIEKVTVEESERKVE